MLDKNQIAERIARELKDGYYVNLGIGIPTIIFFALSLFCFPRLRESSMILIFVC